MDLKEFYSPAFYNNFSDVLTETLPAFDKKKFIEMIFVPDWEQKALKERMRHTTTVLHHFLPKDFAAAANRIENIITCLRQHKMLEQTKGIEFIFFPDYIECYGLNDYETSVKSMEAITQFSSCEFAVRPFILKYGSTMIRQMQQWSRHPHPAVRRLSSEGIRPRLPWAIAIPALKKDPADILPILENLKCDPDESVRRSVANNLNDISKDHPDIVVKIADKWKDSCKETDGIVKHGCRTLLKQGHPDILKLYTLIQSGLQTINLKIHNRNVPIGQKLTFSFSIENENTEPQMIRLEYAIHYLLKNGQSSRKVFKISERIYQPREKAMITRQQNFRLITTRTFYPGQHGLTVIVNGQEKLSDHFNLTN